MRTKTLFLVLVSITSIAAAAEIRGTWTATADGDRVQLSVMREHSNWSHTMPRSDFAITDAQIHAAIDQGIRVIGLPQAGMGRSSASRRKRRWCFMNRSL